MVVNSAGPWSTVRVEQPYGAMQQQVGMCALWRRPLIQCSDRDGALVIQQRLRVREAVALSREAWRRRGCLVLVEG